MQEAAGLDTPVLFIIFNQPEITHEVFAAIRAVRPRKLFVAADGPRADRPGETQECQDARAVTRLVDWDCEVYTRFRDENAGCRVNVSSAISWFLGQAGEGIVLEYDCLPHPSFFTYCETMLARYRKHCQVFSICGSNLQFGARRGDGDYFFARLPNTWGFATWSRAWDKWDGDLRGLPQFLAERQLDNVLHSAAAKKYMTEKFREVYEGRNRTTWGFGWVYAHLAHNAMSIFPNANLISNLGFSVRSTHAVNKDSVFSRIPLVGLTSFRAPSFSIPFIEADECLIRWARHTPWPERLLTGLKAAAVGVLPTRWHAPLKKLRSKTNAAFRRG